MDIDVQKRGLKTAKLQSKIDTNGIAVDRFWDRSTAIRFWLWECGVAPGLKGQDGTVYYGMRVCFEKVFCENAKKFRS